MKRLSVYFFIFIILFAFMAYGISGSGAWFTDQVSIENNLISTGNIDLVVSDIVKSNPMLEPGAKYQEMLRFCVKNGGTYNMKWRGMLKAVQAPAGMVDQLLMRGIILNSEKLPANTNNDDQNIGNIWFSDQPAAVLMSANPYILLNASTNSEPFKPNDRFCYSIQAKLPGSAENVYQQTSFKATLQLDATQWISTESDWTH